MYLLCRAFCCFLWNSVFQVPLSEGCAPNCLLTAYNPRPKQRLKTHCPVCFCCSPNTQCMSLSVVWFVLPPPWFAFNDNNNSWKYSFRSKSSLVQLLNNLKQSCHQEQYMQKGFSFPIFSSGICMCCCLDLAWDFFPSLFHSSLLFLKGWPMRVTAANTKNILQ